MNLRDYQQRWLQQAFSNTETDERLIVYRDASIATRVRALRQQFPCCEKLVGERYFERVATEFSQQYPATDANVQQQATPFIDFLAALPAEKSLPYLVDMARFECAWFAVFHGPSNARIIPQRLIATDTVQCTAGLQLVCSAHPLAQLWQCCQPEYTGDYQLDDTEKTHYFALVQRDAAIHIEEVSEAGWNILQLLRTPRFVSTFFVSVQQLYDAGLIDIS